MFAGGALVGAAAALLLTTKKGEEIRHELSDLMDEWKNGKKPASNQPAKKEA